MLNNILAKPIKRVEKQLLNDGFFLESEKIKEQTKDILNEKSKIFLDKLSNYDENVLLYLHGVLTELSKSGDVKYKTIEYIKENIDNFYVLLNNNSVIGMFCVTNIGENIFEVGTVIVDSKCQGSGIGTIMIEKIIELKLTNNYLNSKFILVTPNVILKYILTKFSNIIKSIDKEIINGNYYLEKRYKKLSMDNLNDGKNRNMYIF